jgi:hypothetical protein
VVTQTASLFIDKNPALDGGLVGPDSYMRAHRVLHLHETGNWFDAFDTRTNTPFGERLHWTRLWDGPLIVGAWIGSIFTEFREALRLWSAAISPLLLIATVFVLRWGTIPLLGSGAFIFMIALLPLMPMLNNTFALGRPDHHGLLAFLFILQLMILLRVLRRPAAQLVLAAGIAAGLSLWVSLEALVPTAFYTAALAILWIWRGSTYARYTTLYLAGAFAAVTIALPIERPWTELAAPAYARLSVVHLILLLAAALAWLAVRRAEGLLELSNWRRRLGAAAAGALVPIVVMAAFFPLFFGGPFVEFDAEVVRPWLAIIAEFQPLLPRNEESTQKFLAYLGPCLVALAYLIIRWRYAADSERDVLFLFGLGLLWFLPFALDARRWASYIEAVALVPWVMAARSALLADPRLPVGQWRIKLRPLIVPAVIVGHLVAVVVWHGIAAPSELPAIASPGPQPRDCDIPSIAEFLGRNHQGGADDDVLFTYLFWGPEFVWRTRYSVVGAPYGNAQALRDTVALFTATEEAEALALVRRRGIDLILICRSYAGNRFYRDEARRTLYSRLEDGRAPGWLRPVPLPDQDAPGFALFRVVRNPDVKR